MTIPKLTPEQKEQVLSGSAPLTNQALQRAACYFHTAAHFIEEGKDMLKLAYMEAEHGQRILLDTIRVSPRCVRCGAPLEMRYDYELDSHLCWWCWVGYQPGASGHQLTDAI